MSKKSQPWPLTDEHFTSVSAPTDFVDKISALLADHPRDIQGAVLGQLMATWLRSHYAKDTERQREIWKALLWEQIKYIIALTKFDRR